MEEYTRRLIHVPIIHSPADMGSMGAELAAACIERLGRRHWDDYVAVLATFWQSIRAGLDGLGLDYSRVDLYQDGLPVLRSSGQVCGKELEIVKAAAAKGSENYQLILDLISRGATLMGTEDPKLLLEEYRNVQAALASRSSLDPGAPGVRQGSSDNDSGPLDRESFLGPSIGAGSVREGIHAPAAGRDSGATGLMAERDAYLGRRINESLRPGRTGILFLGLMHNIESYLTEDIVVTRLASEIRQRRSPRPPTPGQARVNSKEN